MKQKIKAIGTAAMLGLMVLTNVDAQVTKSSAPKQEEYVYATEQETATATVKSIDYKTRKVTLVSETGEVFDIVADEAVKNLNQIKAGDTVVANYKAALVFSVNKGGKVTSQSLSTTSSSARPGSMPGANVKTQVTSTVLISEINRKEPSVTFKNASGESRKFMVKHPERLEGVNVGDTVDITYKEAMAVKVEKKNKQ